METSDGRRSGTYLHAKWELNISSMKARLQHVSLRLQTNYQLAGFPTKLIRNHSINSILPTSNLRRDQVLSTFLLTSTETLGFPSRWVDPFRTRQACLVDLWEPTSEHVRTSTNPCKPLYPATPVNQSTSAGDFWCSTVTKRSMRLE